MKIKTCLALIAAAALLSACGDNPEEADTTSNNQVPASATASTMAWSQFAASLRNSETQAPLDVNSATPPLSESDAPQAI
jgi:ABC-type uncharacterized transport system auxiliary subunit